MSRKLINDENAAATEIGYVFTFLLGLMFLTTFSIWVWGLEVSTQERWTEHALEENLLSVGAAVERADEAARLDPNARYAEPVDLHLSTAAGLNIEMWLTDDAVHISDSAEVYRSSQPISGAAATVHSGVVNLVGIETVWVVLQDGNVTLQVEQPGF
ncbi:MAG: hypothetical protein VX828_07095 [Candidatus Thermoplasmatota archaeon]|jgi:hypothetical protein|nr:hypothetical protein [Candidatus Thermoplasmatota archaeon]GIS43295.1 MAG: hypothetical protein Ct9H90mP16_03650 [Candidatus Poseidoniales archaeon]|tara:strand:- start:23 stop:493 length:471 start_codon:yes stop_codon:yes gene_type:complete